METCRYLQNVFKYQQIKLNIQIWLCVFKIITTKNSCRMWSEQNCKNEETAKLSRATDGQVNRYL